MGWIEKLFKPKREGPPAQISMLCSACLQTCQGAEAHVIPWWNIDLQDFVTTYRCGECFHQSMAETRTRIGLLDVDAREKFCEFLERHGYMTDAQAIRHTSLEEASGMIGAVLNAVESGEVRLSP